MNLFSSRSALVIAALLASASALSAQTQLAPLIQAVRSERCILDKYIAILKSGA